MEAFSNENRQSELNALVEEFVLKMQQLEITVKASDIKIVRSIPDLSSHVLIF